MINRKNIIQILIFIIDKFFISIIWFNNRKNDSTIYLLKKEQYFFLGLTLNIMLNMLQLFYICSFFILIWFFILLFSINSINDFFKTVLKIIIILLIHMIIIYFSIPKMFIILIIILYSVKRNVFTYISSNWHYFYKNKVHFCLTVLNEIFNEIIKTYLKNIKCKKDTLILIITKN